MDSRWSRLRIAWIRGGLGGIFTRSRRTSKRSGFGIVRCHTGEAFHRGPREAESRVVLWVIPKGCRFMPVFLCSFSIVFVALVLFRSNLSCVKTVQTPVPPSAPSCLPPSPAICLPTTTSAPGAAGLPRPLSCRVSGWRARGGPARRRSGPGLRRGDIDEVVHLL